MNGQNSLKWRKAITACVDRRGPYVDKSGPCVDRNAPCVDRSGPYVGKSGPCVDRSGRVCIGTARFFFSVRGAQKYEFHTF